MKRETFTGQEMARITRATQAQLVHLERAGVLRPSSRGSRGRGKKSLYDMNGVRAAALGLYLGRAKMPATEAKRVLAYLNRRQWGTGIVELAIRYDGNGHTRITTMGRGRAPIRVTIDAWSIIAPAVTRARFLALERATRRKS